MKPWWCKEGYPIPLRMEGGRKGEGGGKGESGRKGEGEGGRGREVKRAGWGGDESGIGGGGEGGRGGEREGGRREVTQYTLRLRCE